MMPNITRGGRTAGLMVYLFGKGRSNEHTEQHIVAGDAGIERDFMGQEVTSDLVLDVANYLDAPMRLHGVVVETPLKRYDPELNEDVSLTTKKAAQVWHCSLSLSADEGGVDSEKWGKIARDFVREMGFEEDDEQGTAGCRWVAVHHGVSTAGNDHIHIAVNLVREDGTRASVHQDFRRAQSAANVLERRYGLRVLASREEGLQVPAGTKPAELDRAARNQEVPERDELRRRLRSAAAGSSSESEFIDRARAAQVLVRPRLAKGDAMRVVGYSVALPPSSGANGTRGDAVWFAPSKLDSNLGLGQLRARWGSTPEVEARTVEHWRSSPVSHGAPAAPRAHAERLPAELVQRLNAHGQNVVPDRAAGFDRLAAIDLSISFARASEYFERGAHGPLAHASDVFARAGARSKPTAADPNRARRSDAELGVAAAYQARLMARGSGRNSASGWLAVFRQMQRTGRTLQLQSSMAGRTAQAVSMNAALSGAARAFEDITRAQRSTTTAVSPSRRSGPGSTSGQGRVEGNDHGR